MKKSSMFQIILLCVFGALAVAAVLIFALAVGGNTSNTTGRVVIWGTLDQNAFTTVIRASSESEPQLAQATYVQKDPSTYNTDIINALASGQGPDLFLLREDDAMSFAPRISPIPLTSLSATQFQNTFADAASPFLSGAGVIGIPLGVDPLVLYWNRDTLQSAGFAQPPKYWDEIYDIAAKTTARTDSGTITKSAIGFGEYKNVDNAKDILALLIMQAGGTITGRDATGHVVTALAPKTAGTSQATVDALRFYTGFADPSKDSYYTWNRSLPESRQAFASGDLALYVGFASEEPLIRRMNPNLNFSVAAMPQVRGGSTSIDEGHSYAFAIPRTSQNPQGAVTVAYLLASAANSKALAQAVGISSARRDVLAQPAEGDDQLFNKESIIARSWIDPDPAKTASIFQEMIENTTSGAMLITEAVSRADQELGQLLAELSQ